MKKVFLTLLGIVFASSICFAAPVNKTILAATQLDDDPTSITSSTYGIQGYKKVAFFVSYDETEVGETLSASVAFDVSYDGTNWVDASFHDYGGGATLQTSETLSADGWYYCWLDPDTSIRYVRVVITATATDADDIISVAVYLSGVK